MRFENCVLCYLTFAVFAAAGPILQRSQNPDLSLLTAAANAVSPLSPGQLSALSTAAALQGRAVFFNINDVMEQRIAGNNKACVVINGPYLSTTICSTFGAPRPASPTLPGTDVPAATADARAGGIDGIDGITSITSTQTVRVTRQTPHINIASLQADGTTSITSTQVVTVTRQNPHTEPPSPPPSYNPPDGGDSSTRPAIISIPAVSTEISPVPPGTQSPATRVDMASTPAIPNEPIEPTKAPTPPTETRRLSPLPFSFPFPFPLPWFLVPGTNPDTNSVVKPGLSTILPQGTKAPPRATDTTTTIHLTKTFVSTVIMPPIDTAGASASAPAPAPAPAPPGTNQKPPQEPPQEQPPQEQPPQEQPPPEQPPPEQPPPEQPPPEQPPPEQPPQEQPPQQNMKGGQMMTTTVYITACGPTYSPEAVQGGNTPPPQPAQRPPAPAAPTPTKPLPQKDAPPAPPPQVAPTPPPSRQAPPAPPPAQHEPPHPPPLVDVPGGEGERGGGGGGGGNGRGRHGEPGGGRGGGGRGHGKGHDDDDDDDNDGHRKQKPHEDIHPVTVGDDGAGKTGGGREGGDGDGGGGLLGVLTKAVFG
ncbi:hypothetical protein GX51_08189 [Blastomyces parvus]|uniref:Uncharacterized protein n=1 Tax=Blastomyces parvus TaxID=2060905 RepID=A0A2B7WGK4_9EURO|nr:hypothetical protein GX51_08189 [Blastomyces parvus]